MAFFCFFRPLRRGRISHRNLSIMEALSFTESPRLDDTARFAAMRTEQRIALCLELCDLADSIVEGRPDSDALRRAHPRSAESLELWQKLMKAGFRGRAR